jgi:hypothetical protein
MTVSSSGFAISPHFASADFEFKLTSQDAFNVRPPECAPSGVGRFANSTDRNLLPKVVEERRRKSSDQMNITTIKATIAPTNISDMFDAPPEQTLQNCLGRRNAKRFRGN